MEEAFAQAEAEARLQAALQESQARFDTAGIPDRLNEDWRFGRPHKYAAAMAELLQSSPATQGECTVQHAGESAVRVSGEDTDLLQTEMLMPTIGSDALLGLHLKHFGSGYALYIEQDTREPIVIGYKSDTLYTPSTFIMVAPGVKAHVIEQHNGCQRGSIFAARNIQVAEGAELKVELHVSGCARSMVITNIQNMGGKVRHYTNFSACDWAREETVAEIYTPGADIALFSANKILLNQVLDQHTRQIHHAGGATSNLLYKNVLEDKSSATFAGNIYVAPGAHNTDAYQSNRNLLLSEDATVNSLPGLEILADKVRCSHGSASAPLNEEQLFYLLARGIPRDEATTLLANGFLADAIDQFKLS